MGLKYFFNLWWRNIKGAFFSGFRAMRDLIVDGDRLAAVIMFLIHAVSLPFTITLGACLKTFVDYFTRQGVSSEAREQIRQNIGEMSIEGFNDFKENLVEFPAKSASSKRVILSLRRLDEDKAHDGESRSQREDRVIAAQKDVLVEYVRAPHNNGKALLNRMRLFLPVSQPPEPSEATLTREQVPAL